MSSLHRWFWPWILRIFYLQLNLIKPRRFFGFSSGEKTQVSGNWSFLVPYYSVNLPYREIYQLGVLVLPVVFEPVVYVQSRLWLDVLGNIKSFESFCFEDDKVLLGFRRLSKRSPIWGFVVDFLELLMSYRVAVVRRALEYAWISINRCLPWPILLLELFLTFYIDYGF